VEKEILDESGRVMRVSGEFGNDTRLEYTFGNNVKLEGGRYHFTCRVRGTNGQKVTFELADGWRTISRVAEISLTDEWQEHSVEFEIKTSFEDETTLRFRMPSGVKGVVEIGKTGLKRGD
jgi:hypothetical protein